MPVSASALRVADKFLSRCHGKWTHRRLEILGRTPRNPAHERHVADRLPGQLGERMVRRLERRQIPLLSESKVDEDWDVVVREHDVGGFEVVVG